MSHTQIWFFSNQPVSFLRGEPKPNSSLWDRHKLLWLPFIGLRSGQSVCGSILGGNFGKSRPESVRKWTCNLFDCVLLVRVPVVGRVELLMVVVQSLSTSSQLKSPLLVELSMKCCSRLSGKLLNQTLAYRQQGQHSAGLHPRLAHL